MHQKKRKTLKSTDQTPKTAKSASSPLLTILKLPTLQKVSSPQMASRFFPSPEESKKPFATERKPTQSLFSYPFSKLSEEVIQLKTTQENLIKKSLLLDSRSVEHSPERLPLNNNTSEFQPIHETIEENIKETFRGPSHKDSVCIKDNEESSLVIPVEIERKSRQKTIKIEKAVETCTLMEDELEHLRRVLKIEKERYDTLLDNYTKVVENSKELHNVLAEMEDKNEELAKLKKLYSGLKFQFEEVREKSQIELIRNQKLLNESKEELAAKISEIDNLNILIGKTNTYKNRYAESVAQLESEIQALKRENSTCRSIAENARSELAAFNSRLLQEKSKTDTFESINSQLKALKAQNYDLEDQISVLTHQNLMLAAENNEHRLIFNKAQSDWRAKKQKMKDFIKVLHSKVEAENLMIKQKISEAFRAKRSVTLRDYDSSEVFVKENILRMQQKINDLEAEVSQIKIEKDKAEGSIEYCKNVIETKNAVVNILEDQLRKVSGSEPFKRALIDSRGIIEGISRQLEEVKSHVKCNKCEQAAEFFMLQCEHAVCSTCQNFNEKCPVCSLPGKLKNISVFSQISSLSDKIYISLKSLLTFISKYTN